MDTIIEISQNGHVKRLLDLAPQGAVQADLNGNCLYVNKEWLTISGRKQEDFLGTNWLNMLVEEDKPSAKAMLEVLLKKHSVVRNFNYRMYHPKKGIRHCRANARFVSNEEGEPLYIICYVEDITPEKHKNEYIRLQNELLAALKKIQDQFYLSEQPELLFVNLLNEIVRITQSEYGFIAELEPVEQSPEKSLKILAASQIDWNENHEASVSQETGRDFTNRYGLYKRLNRSGKTFVVNKAQNAPFTKTPIRSFIVLPAKINGKIEGMVGLANRAVGYKDAKDEFLDPLLTTFANLIAFHRLNSEKKRAEQRQQDLTNYLQTIITFLDDVIFEFDGHKRFKNVWVSDEQILFMPPEKFIGKTVEQVFPEQAHYFSKPLDDVLQSGKVVEFEYKHLDPSIDRWYKARITPYNPDPDLTKYRLVMTVQDITVSAKQKQALQEAQQKLEKNIFLLDVTQKLSKVAGWEYFLNTGSMFLTKQAHALYEVDQSFIPTYENTRAFFGKHATGLLDAYAAKAIKERKPYKVELPIITAKNNQKWVRAIGAPLIENGEVIGLRGAILDISEEKEAELVLLQIKEKLEMSNKDKDRIMQVLAHDLRSPLSGIYSMTGILLSNKRLSDKNREMLRIIHESSLSAHDMVSDLIDAMLNNRKESLRISSFSIKELVERCIHLQAARALEKQQQIVLKAQEVKLMQGDPQKIERLMSNLLHNAIKFSPKGAPIEVELKTVKASVKISVKDRGIGIPETIQPHIFDTYSAGMRYGTAGEAPIGIGLSICRQITEAHQGCIGFKSKPEKGSTFYVELPYKYSSAAGKDA